MLTTAFWKGAAERAIKTFFQTFVAVIGAAEVSSTVGVSAGLGDVGWGNVLSVSALAALLSLATSIGNASFTAGAPEVEPEQPIVIEQVSEPVENDDDGSDLNDEESTGKHVDDKPADLG